MLIIEANVMISGKTRTDDTPSSSALAANSAIPHVRIMIDVTGDFFFAMISLFSGCLRYCSIDMFLSIRYSKFLSPGTDECFMFLLNIISGYNLVIHWPPVLIQVQASGLQ